MKRLPRLFVPTLVTLLAFVIAFAPSLDAGVPAAQAQGGDPNAAVRGGAPGGTFAAPSLEPLSAAESVIGFDSRKRIGGTTSNAWRWVVKLEVDFPLGSGGCSGWLVSNQMVMTAGHCVYNPPFGGWADSVRVIPGQNTTIEPFGSQTVPSSDLYAPNGWTSSGDSDYDYAAIILPDTSMGDLVGVVMNMGVFSDDFLLDLTKSNVSGYPGDKEVNGVFGWTMWTDKDPVTSTTAEKANYTIDTFGGQSGSAVWSTYKGKKFGFAVHAYGIGGCDVDPVAGVQNCGARVDDGMMNVFFPSIGYFPSGEFYTDWIAAPTILGPANLLLTNQKVTFSWMMHPDAKKYELEIWKWNETKGEFQRKIKKKTTKTEWAKNLGTGIYAWRLRIEQHNRFPGQWSSGYLLGIDKKKPGKPILVSPAHKSSAGYPTFFDWDPPADTDIAFFEIEVTDKATGWNPPYAETTTTDTFIDGFFSDGTWYWRVRAWDEAGNAGPWSSKWKFDVTGAPIVIGGTAGSLAETAPVPNFKTELSWRPPVDISTGTVNLFGTASSSTEGIIIPVN